MIETLGQAPQNKQYYDFTQNNTRKKVLNMVKNDRMAGTVPSWDAPKTAKDHINENLGAALTDNKSASGFENAMELQASGHTTQNTPEDFGFGDLVDMVNPLHHIPVVSTIYREITGDQIKPIGKIIGGGVFGGAVGAASGLVNVIAEEETGSDLAGNAYNLAFRGERPSFKSNNAQPEQRLEQAQKIAQNPEPLPESLLAFTDQGFKGMNLHDARSRQAAMEHTMSNLPPREPITELDRTQKVPFREL